MSFSQEFLNDLPQEYKELAKTFFVFENPKDIPNNFKFTIEFFENGQIKIQNGNVQLDEFQEKLYYFLKENAPNGTVVIDTKSPVFNGISIDSIQYFYAMILQVYKEIHEELAKQNFSLTLEQLTYNQKNDLRYLFPFRIMNLAVIDTGGNQLRLPNDTRRIDSEKKITIILNNTHVRVSNTLIGIDELEVFLKKSIYKDEIKIEQVIFLDTDKETELKTFFKALNILKKIGFKNIELNDPGE